MALTGHRTFVGFGFGAIQAGLFLYEAFRSGGFARLVVGEVAPDAVEALRRNAGCYAVNVAHADRVEAARVGPVQIENPAAPRICARLVDAVAEAEEISTAVPSVRFYTGPGPGSIHRILAQGLRKKAAAGGPRAVVYAAENHNHAAEILEAAVFDEIPAAEKAPVRERVCFLNTVIGKMSGVISDAGEIQARQLATVTPDSSRAFLVEAFNRILISQVRFPQVAGEPRFQRGITAFVEKEDLLPFEEAKLYGHNATHALAAYLCSLRGLERIADLRQTPDLLGFIRAAFLEESGEALDSQTCRQGPLVHARRIPRVRRRPAGANDQSSLAGQRGTRGPRPAPQIGLGRPPGGNFAPGFAAKHCPPPLRPGDRRRPGNAGPLVSENGHARARPAGPALGQGSDGDERRAGGPQPHRGSEAPVETVV